MRVRFLAAKADFFMASSGKCSDMNTPLPSCTILKNNSLFSFGYICSKPDPNTPIIFPPTAKAPLIACVWRSKYSCSINS
jgi:hypothetical protein